MTDINTFLATASRSDIEREIARVEAELIVARERERIDAIAYASTPDGAAETFRRFELATNPSDRKNLKSIYLAGLTMAGDEYAQRRSRGNAGGADGPLEVIPVGCITEPVNPVVKALVEQRIMGTYRTSERATITERVPVTLLLLPNDGRRRRLKIQAKAELGLFTSTLAGVLVEAWHQPDIQPRLHNFLNDSYTALQTAIERHAQP